MTSRVVVRVTVLPASSPDPFPSAAPSATTAPMLQKPFPKPASPVTRAFGWVRGVMVSVYFMGTLLATNVVQTLSLVVFPFSRRLFRRVNRECANFWWGMCVVGSERFYGVRPVFTGDDVPVGENAIVIANHQQMPDVPGLMMLAWRKRRLGDMKWMVKEVLKYVPGVGWGLGFLDCLFLKRDWDKDRASILATFSRFRSANIPLWLVAFPEGTRITEPKLARSQKYASTAGLPVTETVLLPRTKGFVATVTGLAGHAEAVYDVTIGYPNGIPTLWQYLQGFVPEIHLHVRRYPIAQLPGSPDALSKWLVDRFEEKDERLRQFLAVGAFA